MEPVYTLELCSGTGSFSKVMQSRGYEVVTVDINPQFTPTHAHDILTFPYKKLYPNPDHFKYVWASPPCTQYSNAKRSGTRDLKTADLIVQRCLEIIRYYNGAALWALENPFTGMLKSRSFMQGMPFFKVHYCQYDDCGRKKSTAIWSNATDFEPRTCPGKGLCATMVGRGHRATCTGSYYDPMWRNVAGRAVECARVPGRLVHELFRETCGKMGRSAGGG